jgi:mannose-6-phosphate isomerase-like protein (cupin superfamily)
MRDPIVASGDQPVSVAGTSFEIHEWSGSGPAAMHIHHADDEAWHVLEGSTKFRFADREAVVGTGATVLVPAGVAHT